MTYYERQRDRIEESFGGWEKPADVNRHQERAREQKRCQAPSCWERGTVIVVEGGTKIATRLCNRHRKSFLGVSS